MDWLKEKAYGVLAVAEPLTLGEILVRENIEKYREALHGDWDVNKAAIARTLAEQLYGAIAEKLPEKIDILGELPSIAKLALDVEKVRELRARARQIDTIADGLRRVQSAIDRAQKHILSNPDITSRAGGRGRPVKPNGSSGGITSSTVAAEKDYSELDKAILQMAEDDQKGLNEFAGNTPSTRNELFCSFLPLDEKNLADHIARRDALCKGNPSCNSEWQYGVSVYTPMIERDMKACGFTPLKIYLKLHR